MKTKSILFVLFSILLSTIPLTAETKKAVNSEKVLLSVDMDCNSCKQKIEKNIAFEKGVKSLDVKLEKKTVEVTYDNRKTNVENLVAGFRKIGYEAKVIKPVNKSVK
ncbi:MAG TPA: heavy-metal-associated domain-containing protein [Paludibacter sp.]|nr:heavy-metal-associated domain-containing protein [Paludibacter sp.]